MNNFGETIRDLRIAQDLGLRETATIVGISPTYLSRIERGKERPPRPETIKSLAKILAADPDVLFRLASSTDPNLVEFINETPHVIDILRMIKKSNLQESDIQELGSVVEKFILRKSAVD